MAVGVLTNFTVDNVSGYATGTLTADSSPSACSIFCGFKPRVIRSTQISGTVIPTDDAAASSKTENHA